MNKRNYKKNLHAYSILELIVSLGIISFLVLSFFTVITNGLRISSQNIARNTIREEISNLLSMISRDIRSADFIDLTKCTNQTCEIQTSQKRISWEICEDKICKYSYLNGIKNLDQKSSETLSVSLFIFDVISPSTSSISKTSVYVSIAGSHVNPDRKVTNVFRQTNVSTRNYEI